MIHFIYLFLLLNRYLHIKQEHFQFNENIVNSIDIQTDIYSLRHYVITNTKPKRTTVIASGQLQIRLFLTVHGDAMTLHPYPRYYSP